MFDELDDYRCPLCGRSNETCKCEDDFEYDYYNPYDYDWEIPYDDCWIDEDEEEIICYLDGKPLYKSDLESMELAG